MARNGFRRVFVVDELLKLLPDAGLKVRGNNENEVIYIDSAFA